MIALESEKANVMCICVHRDELRSLKESRRKWTCKEEKIEWDARGCQYRAECGRAIYGYRPSDVRDRSK